MATTETLLTAKITALMADGRDTSDMGALIAQAIADAFTEGRRYLWERCFTDLVGNGVAVRFALVGEEVVIAPAEEQPVPLGLTGTYVDISAAALAKDEQGKIVVEQATDLTGAAITSGAITAVVSTTAALTNLSILRLNYYRRPIQPAVTTNYLPMPERYLIPATLGKLHAYLIANGMSGDIERHEKLAQYWDTKAEKILMEVAPTISPPAFRLRGY